MQSLLQVQIGIVGLIYITELQFISIYRFIFAENLLIIPARSQTHRHSRQYRLARALCSIRLPAR